MVHHVSSLRILWGLKKINFMTRFIILAFYLFAYEVDVGSIHPVEMFSKKYRQFHAKDLKRKKNHFVISTFCDCYYKVDALFNSFINYWWKAKVQNQI
jgi:hypothetical protein